jgi:hypothetical protein
VKLKGIDQQESNAKTLSSERKDLSFHIPKPLTHAIRELLTAIFFWHRVRRLHRIWATNSIGASWVWMPVDNRDGGAKSSHGQKLLFYIWAGRCLGCREALSCANENAIPEREDFF